MKREAPDSDPGSDGKRKDESRKANSEREEGRQALTTAFDLKEDVRAEVEKRHEYWKENESPYRGHSTGLKALDDIIEGISQCGLYLLAGMPGVGKTSLATQIALEVAGEIPVVYLSFENRPADLTWRLLSSTNSTTDRPLDIDRFRTGDVDEEEIEALLSTESFEEHLENLYFLDGRDLGDTGLELEVVKSLIEQIETPEGLTEGLPHYLLVIDYLQLWAKRPDVTRDLKSNSTRFRIQKLASDLSELARGPTTGDEEDSDVEGNLGVLAVASQNRQSYQSFGGSKHEEQSNSDTLKSLKGSGDLEYIADVAMSLQSSNASDSSERKVTLNVAKNRYGETGAVDLTFYPQMSLWEESED